MHTHEHKHILTSSAHPHRVRTCVHIFLQEVRTHTHVRTYILTSSTHPHARAYTYSYKQHAPTRTCVHMFLEAAPTHTRVRIQILQAVHPRIRTCICISYKQHAPLRTCVVYTHILTSSARMHTHVRINPALPHISSREAHVQSVSLTMLRSQ